jgi:hypothetical protein
MSAAFVPNSNLPFLDEGNTYMSIELVCAVKTRKISRSSDASLLQFGTSRVHLQLSLPDGCTSHDQQMLRFKDAGKASTSTAATIQHLDSLAYDARRLCSQY